MKVWFNLVDQKNGWFPTKNGQRCGSVTSLCSNNPYPYGSDCSHNIIGKVCFFEMWMGYWFKTHRYTFDNVWYTFRIFRYNLASWISYVCDVFSYMRSIQTVKRSSKHAGSCCCVLKTHNKSWWHALVSWFIALLQTNDMDIIHMPCWLFWSKFCWLNPNFDCLIASWNSFFWFVKSKGNLGPLTFRLRLWSRVAQDAAHDTTALHPNDGAASTHDTCDGLQDPECGVAIHSSHT